MRTTSGSVGILCIFAAKSYIRKMDVYTHSSFQGAKVQPKHLATLLCTMAVAGALVPKSLSASTMLHDAATDASLFCKDDADAHPAAEVGVAPASTMSSKEEAASTATSGNASTLVADAMKAFKPTIKAGGYIITQYSHTDREDKPTDGGFNVRLVRAYVSGTVCQHVGYRLQLELNDAPGIDRGPRVVDAFVEYTRHKEWQPKIGQFKRCFGFENPVHPMFAGMGSFATSTVKLQSLNDRIGEHRSNGRDIGLEFQGDLFPIADNHRLLHYQVGLYNGQGTNHADMDHHKDLIGGLWVVPVKGLRIGAFGWNGYHVNEQNPSQSLRRVRYDLGLSYEGAWSARAEYVHSVGGTTKGGPTESDGWYAMVGVPVPKCKAIKIYGRWDCYRDDATRWDGLLTNYGLSANYFLGENFVFQLNYTHTIDRNLMIRGGNYNTFDVQVSARF